MSYQIRTVYKGILDSPDYANQSTLEDFKEQMQNGEGDSDFIQWLRDENFLSSDDEGEKIVNGYFNMISETFDEDTQTYITVKDWTTKENYDAFRKICEDAYVAKYSIDQLVVNVSDTHI